MVAQTPQSQRQVSQIPPGCCRCWNIHQDRIPRSVQRGSEPDHPLDPRWGQGYTDGRKGNKLPLGPFEPQGSQGQQRRQREKVEGPQEVVGSWKVKRNRRTGKDTPSLVVGVRFGDLRVGQRS